jgi:hypothetical protein
MGRLLPRTEMYIIKKGLIIIPKANNKEKYEIAKLWEGALGTVHKIINF